jgi:hypothetical protein
MTFETICDLRMDDIVTTRCKGVCGVGSSEPWGPEFEPYLMHGYVSPSVWVSAALCCSDNKYS